MGQQECPMLARRRLDYDLGDLERLSRSALGRLWRQEFGGEPPSSFGGDLLALAIAHARQERQYGGIPKSVARELDRLFDRALLGSSGSGGQEGTGTHSGAHKRNGQSPKLARPGSILMREWQGTTHQVTVLADGFLWNGRAHTSLSGIARAITGTKWSGPRFFGMREPNDAL
jgi:Protein of unknown function (DUF2924)